MEEISGNFDFDFSIDKKIIYSNQNINNKNNSLYKFLRGINYEKYATNFYEGGYYNSEIIFVQMASKETLNENILINDLGVNKSDAVKIIQNFKDGSNKYIQNIDKNKNKCILEENNNIKSCGMCLLF